MGRRGESEIAAVDKGLIAWAVVAGPRELVKRAWKSERRVING